MMRSVSQSLPSRFWTLVLFLAAIGLTGCGGLGGSPSSHPAVTVTPAQSQVRAGSTQQFSASVVGVEQQGSPSAPPPRGTRLPLEPMDAPTKGIPISGRFSETAPPTGNSGGVNWSVNGIAGGNATAGTIDKTGLYTAPSALPANTAVTITATSAANTAVSGEAAVSLENAIPILQGVQPGSVTVGSFTLSVTGSKFVNGAVVLLSGTALPTTFASQGVLNATGVATPSQVGKATITVKNPDPGAILSATSLQLQIQPPLTVAVAVSPATAQVRNGGTQQFSATVTGSSNSSVTWAVGGVQGGSASLGTVAANGLYTAPANMPSTSSVSVSATSVADSRASGAATVALENPIPVVTTVSPNSVTVGNFQLSVTGSNFVSGASVSFGGQFLDTTFVSSTKVTATGTALAQQIGTVAMEVQNPDPGSSSSNPVNVQVTS